jgi:hypothetical protein
MKELLRKLILASAASHGKAVGRARERVEAGQAETTAQKPDEYIALADVGKAVEYYKKIILRFLA